ncbi:GNAT family N-acetyltransferase [Haladaptatus sp. W1]|uniref:GNAT family N-acetyltransferase n=1 Tax=Haladaptatus sp. W1 TaxID=1897478 RepID=UPI001586D45E|nr:GNAT family N-acetyltransferase [Haladaptatus sp. W1]
MVEASVNCELINTRSVPRWTVRRYRDADKNAVWRVHDRSLRDSAMRYSPEYNRYLRHIPTEFLEREGEFLVVTDNATAANATIVDRLHARTNGIAGIGGFQPLARSKADDSAIRRARDADASTAHVRSVAVLPEVQSTGVGTVLMSALEKRAADRGFTQAVLSTPVELTDAHGFCESRGYRVVPMPPDRDGGTDRNESVVGNVHVEGETDADAAPEYYWYRKSGV